MGLSLNRNFTHTCIWPWYDCDHAHGFKHHANCSHTCAKKCHHPHWGGSTGHNAVMAQCAIHEFQRTHILLAETGPKGVTNLAEVMEGGGGLKALVIELRCPDLTDSLPVCNSICLLSANRGSPYCMEQIWAKMLTAMQPLEEPQERQEPEVWEQLAKLKMPGIQRHFVRKVLWKKLTVGTRTQKHITNQTLTCVPK